MDTLADRILDLVEAMQHGGVATGSMSRVDSAVLQCELALLGARVRRLERGEAEAPAPVVALPAHLAEQLATFGIAANTP